MPTVQLLAFRGTGGFRGTKYKHLPSLVKAGHVGIKFEDDPKIYGFHPTPEAKDAAGGESALFIKLVKGEAQEGRLQDDTDIFIQAHDLHGQGEDTDVWVLEQTLEQKEYDEIRERTLRWYEDAQRVAQYTFPKRDGSFNPRQYNCATFPATLGIKIPIYNGKLAVYIQAMKEIGAKRWYPPQENS